MVGHLATARFEGENDKRAGKRFGGEGRGPSGALVTYAVPT